MAINLCNYEAKAREATMAFWGNREKARQKQIETGKADQGERAGVTAGKNMDGFLALLIDIVRANGLAHAQIHQQRAALTLPGYFRPTKLWDVLVINEGRLVAAIELKSQVGPSFGNNFNNRAEEAIGTAHDLRTAYREGAFGQQTRPFTGWMMMVEDAPESRRPELIDPLTSRCSRSLSVRLICNATICSASALSGSRCIRRRRFWHRLEWRFRPATTVNSVS